jgi:hypothetical protein
MVEIPAPGAGMVLGTKVIVAPEGAPADERLMGALKPPLIAVEIADVPGLPCGMESEAGKAETVKLPDSKVTVSVTVVFC